MLTRYAVADIASLVGEPSRAGILLALFDGRALPAGDLAREARLSPAATSLHLAKLTQGGLLAVQKQGRHRYYRLAGPDVAHAVEALGSLALAPAPCRRPLTPKQAALRGARTCYDHLAGIWAVALAEKLEREGVLLPRGDVEYEVTRDGARWLRDAFGIDTAALPHGRRPAARRCIDWTERRPHVAGALGAAVLAEMVSRRWVVRQPASRAVRLTPRGQLAFADLGLRGDAP